MAAQRPDRFVCGRCSPYRRYGRCSLKTSHEYFCQGIPSDGIASGRSQSTCFMNEPAPSAWLRRTGTSVISALPLARRAIRDANPGRRSFVFGRCVTISAVKQLKPRCCPRDSRPRNETDHQIEHDFRRFTRSMTDVFQCQSSTARNRSRHRPFLLRAMLRVSAASAIQCREICVGEGQ